MTKLMISSSIVLWLKRWLWELAGLFLVSLAVAADRGLKTGILVFTGLITVAVLSDLVCSSIFLVRRTSSVVVSGYFLNILFVIVFYTYLIVDGLTKIIYLTIAPALILGVLIYFFRKR